MKKDIFYFLYGTNKIKNTDVYKYIYNNPEEYFNLREVVPVFKLKASNFPKLFNYIKSNNIKFNIEDNNSKIIYIFDNLELFEKRAIFSKYMPDFFNIENFIKYLENNNEDIIELNIKYLEPLYKSDEDNHKRILEDLIKMAEEGKIIFCYRTFNELAYFIDNNIYELVKLIKLRVQTKKYYYGENIVIRRNKTTNLKYISENGMKIHKKNYEILKNTIFYQYHNLESILNYLSYDNPMNYKLLLKSFKLTTKNFEKFIIDNYPDSDILDIYFEV